MPIKVNKKLLNFKKTMWNADTDKKTFFVAATRLHPEISSSSWALVKI